MLTRICLKVFINVMMNVSLKIKKLNMLNFSMGVCKLAQMPNID